MFQLDLNGILIIRAQTVLLKRCHRYSLKRTYYSNALSHSETFAEESSHGVPTLGQFTCLGSANPSHGVMLICPPVFVAGDPVIQVLVLRKIFSAKPQQFMLVLKDAAKVQNTEFGAEGEVRTILKAVGISQPEIEKLFEQAKSNTKPTFTPRNYLVIS